MRDDTLLPLLLRDAPLRPDHCFQILHLFRPALVSGSEEVARAACRLVAALAHALGGTEYRDDVRRWFLTADGRGLAAVVLAERRHPHIRSELARVLAAACAVGGPHGSSKGGANYVLGKVLQGCMAGPEDYLAFLAQVLGARGAARRPGGGGAPSLHELCVGDGACDMAMRVAQWYAEPSIGSEGARIAAFNLMAELWFGMPDHIAADPKIPKAVLALLKKGVRDETSMSIQVNAVSTLFRMLDVFAERHDPYAPFVYKARLITLTMICCGDILPPPFVRSLVSDVVCGSPLLSLVFVG